MYAHVEKTKENKSRAVAKSVTQEKDDEQGFGFVDNRPQIVCQRKLFDIVTNNLNTKQLKADLIKVKNISQVVIQRAKLGEGKLDSARSYVNWYFKGKNPKKKPGDILREIYTQIGVDNNSVSERRTQTKLLADNVIDEQDISDLENAVDLYLGGGKEKLPPRRKIIPPGSWKHIWRGDFNKNKNKATGYHWKGKGSDSWLEGTGTQGKSKSEFYEEQVKVRDDKVDDINNETGVSAGKIRGKIKDDMSTFFPDDWSEKEVQDAVETRNSDGEITSKSADGITLVKSGTTIYPQID